MNIGNLKKIIQDMPDDADIILYRTGHKVEASNAGNSLLIFD